MYSFTISQVKMPFFQLLFHLKYPKKNPKVFLKKQSQQNPNHFKTIPRSWDGNTDNTQTGQNHWAKHS